MMAAARPQWNIFYEEIRRVSITLHGPLLGPDLFELSEDKRFKMLSLQGRLPRWFILGLLAGAGILICIPVVVSPSEWGTIPRDIGVAMLVASILGFTIDRWMKEELRTDAVKATLNAIIRPEFHSKLQRIFTYEFLCEYHYMTISIRRIIDNDEQVRVTVVTERRLCNISGAPKEIPGSVHIDEWGFEGNKSSIDGCSIHAGGIEKEVILIAVESASNASCGPRPGGGRFSTGGPRRPPRCRSVKRPLSPSASWQSSRDAAPASKSAAALAASKESAVPLAMTFHSPRSPVFLLISQVGTPSSINA